MENIFKVEEIRKEQRNGNSGFSYQMEVFVAKEYWKKLPLLFLSCHLKKLFVLDFLHISFC